MKKRWIPAGVLFLLTVCLLGFLWDSVPAAQTETHTLRIVLWDYDTVEYDRKVVECFQAEHPEILLEIISSPPAYYNNRLESMLDSGERIDILFVNQQMQLPSLIADGVALPLDSLIGRDGISLDAYPDVTALRDPDSGALLALPYRKDKFVLFYNKELFDLAEIPYPTEPMTWEAFRQTAAELTRRLRQDRPDAWGAYFLKKEPHLFYLLQSKPFAWETDDFTAVRPGLNLLLAMQADGSIPPFRRAAMAQDSQRMFEQGNYAMFVHGSWYLNFLAMDEARGVIDFDWGVVERPQWSMDEPNRNDAWITPVMIHRDTPEPEAAPTLLKYICGEEGAELLAEELILPALRSDNVDHILREQLEARGLQGQILDGFSAPTPPPPFWQQQMIDAVYEQFSRALLSLDTVEGCIQAMEAARANCLR